VDRIIDVFPPQQQQQIRFQLAMTLQGIIAQQLLPRFDGRGRVLATEILIATNAIRHQIRDEKTHQIYSAIQTGKEAEMQTMDEALMRLYSRGIIGYDVAISRARDPESFRSLM
jgi:twitching motility protein PilT